MINQEMPDSNVLTVNQTGSLPSATTILGQAWTIYKERLSTFLGVLIIPGLIMVLFSVIPTNNEFLGIGVSSILIILLFVPVVLSQTWAQLALLYVIKDRQEKIGIIEAYRRSWSKILSFLWIALLLVFIIMGGFLLLIVPGIIFAIWFSLANYILITEDLKGVDALLKSKEYVTGYWGGVFWRLFFISIIIGTISFATTFILGYVLIPLSIPFVFYLFQLILGLFLPQLMMIYIFLVYSHLRNLKKEIAFTPPTGKRGFFIFAGILGLLTIPLAIFSKIFLNSLYSAREKAYDAKQQIELKSIQ